MLGRRTFFTADTHFSHAGIIARCSRPFADVRDMDEMLIDGWNAVVGKSDIVHHLGDFAHRATPQRMKAIFDRLNGAKFLTVGNHDDGATKKLPWAGPPQQMTEITVEGQRLFLCHYAMRTWRGQHRGVVQLYGHSHGRLPGTSLSTDVGIDCWGYCPVTIQQIQQRLVAQPPAETEGDLETEGPQP